jgi:hypothetical protein
MAVHRLAKTYGKLPSEVLETDVHSFNLNLAIMGIGLASEPQAKG